MDYSQMDATAFIRKVRRGEVDLPAFYSKIFGELKSLDSMYKLMVTISEEEAMEQLGSRLAGKLAGLPVSAKDCICTEGVQTTAGSRILQGYKPPFDAFAVEKVKREGGVIIGKTQQDEFGFGSFGVHSGYGIPRNPLDPERSCGGSSGGAAGLVRALEYPHIALAESTGGSISCPASFCGVVGFTPTYGLVSRWGLIDYANSLDKIGAITRTVRDAELASKVIEGFDSRDFTSVKRKASFSKELKGMRIGLPMEYFHGVDSKVAGLVKDSVAVLEREGAIVSKVSLPNTRHALPAYYVIASAEASTNLARYCGMRYGASSEEDGMFNEYFSSVRSTFLGEEAKRRVLMGTFARMAGFRDQFHLKALKVRTLVMRDFEKAFRKVDVLAAPTMPVTAPKFSEIEKLSPLEHYMMDSLVVGPNLAGIPQLSVPCGSLEGMPVGLHILADHLQEGKLFSAGRAVEAANRTVEMG